MALNLIIQSLWNPDLKSATSTNKLLHSSSSNSPPLFRASFFPMRSISSRKENPQLFINIPLKVKARSSQFLCLVISARILRSKQLLKQATIRSVSSWKERKGCGFFVAINYPKFKRIWLLSLLWPFMDQGFTQVQRI